MSAVSRAIDNCVNFVKPLNKIFENSTHQVFSGCLGKAKAAYDNAVVTPVRNWVAAKEGKYAGTIETIVKVAPIAAAFLILTNPISLTSGFLGYAIVGALILAGTDKIFSDEGRKDLCKGASLASGISTIVHVGSMLAYGVANSSMYALAGKVAFTAIFYYASTYGKNTEGNVTG